MFLMSTSCYLFSQLMSEHYKMCSTRCVVVASLLLLGGGGECGPANPGGPGGIIANNIDLAVHHRDQQWTTSVFFYEHHCRPPVEEVNERPQE